VNGESKEVKNTRRWKQLRAETTRQPNEPRVGAHIKLSAFNLRRGRAGRSRQREEIRHPLGLLSNLRMGLRDQKVSVERRQTHDIE